MAKKRKAETSVQQPAIKKVAVDLGLKYTFKAEIKQPLQKAAKSESKKTTKDQSKTKTTVSFDLGLSGIKKSTKAVGLTAIKKSSSEVRKISKKSTRYLFICFFVP